MTISDLGKPFPKKTSNNFKKTENQCQNAVCEQKSLAGKRFFFKHRFLTRL